MNADLANLRYADITKDLPKDENGFTGKDAKEQFENMLLHLTMAMTGQSEAAARKQREHYAESRNQEQLNIATADTWP